MNKYVTDTQAIIKFINGQKVISSKVTSIFKDADKGKNIIIIPSIVLFEIGYLHEKSRIPVSINDMENIIRVSVNYLEEKLSIDIIKTAFEITDIPELHDRLIAGTARYLDIPLITNDPVILKSRFVKTIN
ncbi:MAG TPA: PIN domain-containing protein [Spirochaetota bacterium]|nr:PIN domain-containing protein [Spirochaetota bacterium]HPF07388.1 PIN domain-containing protein [Spirochaetota bacterium]HPJ43088.1 PIN domain-containing protein [Spirochaetota bacterium]HPR38333.1 PIN domain-containing protein [Spirochaetota bacterium]HRX48375.1 PIN domain-containing protein [Spirochaetota bacterium]